ncbi:hypothetical protein MJO10_31465, partial [Salmonella enterica subsp. enterica serovar Anatum]|nr:hypothetical protein [Salmonella enterica subsp. enterica serovar Anatum]
KDIADKDVTWYQEMEMVARNLEDKELLYSTLEEASKKYPAYHMLPFMTPVFLQIGLGFSPFHAGLMMIPMVLGSMGMKRIVVQI